MIILRGVNVFPTQVEVQVLAVEGLAPHFQIELIHHGRMDGMIVHVEATKKTLLLKMHECNLQSSCPRKSKTISASPRK